MQTRVTQIEDVAMILLTELAVLALVLCAVMAQHLLARPHAPYLVETSEYVDLRERYSKGLIDFAVLDINISEMLALEWADEPGGVLERVPRPPIRIVSCWRFVDGRLAYVFGDVIEEFAQALIPLVKTLDQIGRSAGPGFKAAATLPFKVAQHHPGPSTACERGGVDHNHEWYLIEGSENCICGRCLKKIHVDELEDEPSSGASKSHVLRRHASQAVIARSQLREHIQKTLVGR